jgi:hypothetical protein
VDARIACERDEGADRQALDSFVVANTELETLEALLGQFNIFDAIGVARQELRHSDFLAFLLDPRQNHGLGDAFLKQFLQAALIGAERADLPIGVIDLDVWSFDGVKVDREWRNIDILLTDERHALAVIIENKVDSAEHSDQLGRYLRVVRHAHPEWRVLPIYLTPAGDTPSEAAFLPVAYGQVCASVETVAASRRAALDPAVHALMTHYARLLRRDVMSDSEIALLCRRIYEKHKRALDLIYTHRPSLQDDLSRLLVALVEAEPGLILDGAARASVRFGLRAWETPALKAGTGGTPSGWMLLFEFGNRPNRLDLGLHVGPGPAETRRALINAARARMPPFAVATRVTPKWTRIYRRPILSPDDYDGSDMEAVEPRVRERWAAFLKTDLPAIADALRIDGLTN